MKPINFIQSIPPHEQKSVLRWYQITVLLFVVGLSAVAFKQVTQLQHLFTARKATDSLSAHVINTKLLEQHHALKHLELTLKTQLDVVSDITEAPISLHNHLQTIKSFLTPGVALTTCTINTNAVSLTLECSQAAQITNFVADLAKVPPFTALKLVSLQPNYSAGFLATIVGTLKSV